jgi:uncharacterized integral membrane protein
MRVRLIVGLVLIAAALLFIFQNVGMIEIRFMVWSISMSRSLLLFVVLGAGVLIGWLWHGVSAWRSRRRDGA